MLFFSSSSSADRQERPAGNHLGGGLRCAPAEAAEGQTDAERDGRVRTREVTVPFSTRDVRLTAALEAGNVSVEPPEKLLLVP